MIPIDFGIDSRLVRRKIETYATAGSESYERGGAFTRIQENLGCSIRG